MKMNKKGLSTGAGIAIGILGVIVTLVAITYLPAVLNKGFDMGVYLSQYKLVGDAIDQPQYNFLSYIIGGVPEALIMLTNPLSALIIIALSFFILAMMFGDILANFGTFSDKWIAWMIGLALAVIGANFNLVMILASAGFAFISGIGALAVIAGVLFPFVVYLGVHLLATSGFAKFFLGRKSKAELDAQIGHLKDGIKSAKEFGKAVREDPAP